MTFIWAYLWNTGSLLLMLKRMFKLGNSKTIINAAKGGGSTRSSDDRFCEKGGVQFTALTRQWMASASSLTSAVTTRQARAYSSARNYQDEVPVLEIEEARFIAWH